MVLKKISDLNQLESNQKNQKIEQINKITESHKKKFGTESCVVAITPCRFHLIGEHTWFFGGKTLSMAINRFVCISVSFRNDDNFYFHFSGTEDTKHIAVSALRFRKEDKWANAIKSVIYGFIACGFIENISGLDFSVSSELPQSAGMGVTTAFKICTANVLNELFELDCSDSEIFEVIEKGNIEFLKEKGENHFSENITAMFSEKNSVVLTNHSKRKLSQDSFSILNLDFSGKTILLVDAKVPRFSMWQEESIMTNEYKELLDSLKNSKQNIYGGWIYTEDRGEVTEALDNLKENDRRHLQGVINEHKCVLDAYDALQKGNFAMFAKAVNRSHENMRDLYDISCPEIDWILKRLVEINPNPDKEHNPVCCGRITGQGFGRSLFAIIDDNNLPEFEEKLSEYTKIFGFKTSCYKVEASNGVQIINM